MTNKRKIDLEFHTAVDINLEINVDVAPTSKKIILVDRKSNTEERKETDGVVVKSEGESGLEIIIKKGIQEGIKEDDSEALIKKVIEEIVVIVEFIINTTSSDFDGSNLGSFDGYHPQIGGAAINTELSLSLYQIIITIIYVNCIDKGRVQKLN